MPSYKLVLEPNTEQTPEDRTFKGGSPNMPARLLLPICADCGREMIFFFQIEFPKKHVWQGWVMCVFQCVECENPIPHLFYKTYIKPEERTQYGLKRDQPSHITLIPDGELDVDVFQRRFRILLYKSSESSVVQTSPRHYIKFEHIHFEALQPNNRFLVSKVGGKAGWWHETEHGENDEAWYMGERLEFLMQIAEWTFPTVENAPIPKDQFQASLYVSDHAYRLFRGGATYFQGTTSSKFDPPLVLVSNHMF
jgi:uncharacterized protein (DUF427 family)